ncbi:MAG: GntR family transcriptional regulator [Planctomycetota bacterium]
MYLRIEQNSGLPLGPQIVGQLKLAIASGRLGPGERLPGARDLAAELRVNFHTVRKAYGELEREGLLVSTRGRGTFVAEELPDSSREQLEQTVRDHLTRLVEDLAGSGLRGKELTDLVVETLDGLQRVGEQETEESNDE